MCVPLAVVVFTVLRYHGLQRLIGPFDWIRLRCIWWSKTVVDSHFFEEVSKDFSGILGSIIGDHGLWAAKPSYYLLIQRFGDHFSRRLSDGAALYPFGEPILKNG